MILTLLFMIKEYLLCLFSMTHTLLLMIQQNYSNAWPLWSSPYTWKSFSATPSHDIYDPHLAPDDPLVLLLLKTSMILTLLLMILQCYSYSWPLWSSTCSWWSFSATPLLMTSMILTMLLMILKCYSYSWHLWSSPCSWWSFSATSTHDTYDPHLAPVLRIRIRCLFDPWIRDPD